MFLCSGFTKVPNNMILMSHRCIEPGSRTTLCVHVLQRLGGPGEAGAFFFPEGSPGVFLWISYFFMKLYFP